MYKYFETYQDAMKFIRNSGNLNKPEKREVWIYPSFEMVWSVKA